MNKKTEEWSSSIYVWLKDEEPNSCEGREWPV
jgi:hypothetical protein